MTDCLEDIIENLKHKNPNVKLETMRFLIRCLRITRDVPSKPEQKQIAESAGKLLADTSAPMRDCAAESMGTLMKIIGERAFTPYLEGLDDIRKTKIKEFFESATVKAKEKPKPVAPPPAAKPPPRKLGAKPGLKAPLKKVAPKAAAPPPPPVEEPPKPTARAAPVSKLGAPKSALGGSRLQKPVPTSPKRALPREYEEEEPAPVAPPSRLGLGRGLTGRPLSKDVPAPSALSRPDPQAAANKAELDELRMEREKWERQMKDDKAEKTRLLQEINDLQLQVSDHL